MINKCENMSKELCKESNKIKNEILERELTLVIQAINAQDDLNKVRDKLSEQLVEIREFINS